MTDFLPLIIIGIVLLALIIIIMTGYLKAPPDTAFIISGLRRKVVIGKATIKIPLLERLDKLSLKLIPVDVKTSAAVPTADYINVNVDAAVNVKISDDPKRLELAAQNFLNQGTDYIRSVAKEVLEGNMREIVGQMRLEEMVSNRQKFAEQVKANAEPDLAAMGLDIVSFNVQNFSDNNGVIDDLGIDNISKIKKSAAIAKAEADKEIAVARSQADKEANDARVKAEVEIAQKNNELAMRQAELKTAADTKKAEADAAYKIQEQTQRRTIEVATVDASIAKTEREAELKSKEVEVQKQTLDAEIRAKADAERYRQEQISQSELFKRQKEAEARQYEQEKEAEAQKAVAEAARFAKEQEAAGIAAVGNAEAEAIKARGLAEAEAMEKKAEAYKKYGQAAMAEMIVKILPEVAGRIAEPLTKIDKITIYGGNEGSQSSLDAVAGNVPALLARTFDTVKDTTGVDLTDIMRGDSIEAKVTRNLNVSGLTESSQPPVPTSTNSPATSQGTAEDNMK